MFVNHWGKWVDSESAVTGVISLGSLEHIHDLVTDGSVIDLTYEEGLKEFMRVKTRELVVAYYNTLWDDEEVNEPQPTEEELAAWQEEHNESIEYCDVPSDYLIGAWRKDEAGLYEPDDDLGEDGFAAIVRTDSNVAQVVKSKWVRRGALCSPCYPGQVDLDTPGIYLGYDFPEWVYGDRGQNPESQEEYKPDQVLYTIVVQVRAVVNGVVQDDYYLGDEEGLFRGTCQAPRGDWQAVNNIARGAWNIIDDQLRSIPE